MSTRSRIAPHADADRDRYAATPAGVNGCRTAEIAGVEGSAEIFDFATPFSAKAASMPRIARRQTKQTTTSTWIGYATIRLDPHQQGR
jgi:hypothetical protein